MAHRLRLSAWVVLGVGATLHGCATQHDTAQALTIAGAAAVVVGASMAADEQCYGAGPGEGGVQAYCSPSMSKGARAAGKGVAVAGVGLAAAGYALRPRGPDGMRPPSDPDPAPAAPYRLIRRDPAPEPAAGLGQAAGLEQQVEPPATAPAGAPIPEAVPRPSSMPTCRAGGSPAPDPATAGSKPSGRCVVETAVEAPRRPSE